MFFVAFEFGFKIVCGTFLVYCMATSPLNQVKMFVKFNASLQGFPAVQRNVFHDEPSSLNLLHFHAPDIRLRFHIPKQIYFTWLGAFLYDLQALFYWEALTKYVIHTRTNKNNHTKFALLCGPSTVRCEFIDYHSDRASHTRGSYNCLQNSFLLN